LDFVEQYLCMGSVYSQHLGLEIGGDIQEIGNPSASQESLEIPASCSMQRFHATILSH
jgi:hypothetical protein